MSDEYIKKEDAIEWFQGMLDHDGSDYDIGVGGCIAAVKRRIPPADVEPVRHGYWTEKEVISDYKGMAVINEWQSARCSACGKYHTTPYSYYFTNYDYCPNCGAKMDKGKGSG